MNIHTMTTGRRLTARNMRRLHLRKGDNRGGDMGGGAPAGFSLDGEAIQPGNGNNQGGNAGANNAESGVGNNTGPAFDPEAFWNPAPAGEAAGQGASPGSAPAVTPPAEADPNVALGQELASTLESYSGGDIMTAAMAEQMANGDYAGFNSAMNQQMQGVMRNTLQMSVKIMKAMRDSIVSQTTDTVKQEFGTREQTAALHAGIPSAANPRLAPIIAPIWAQALKVSKGDTAKAITMTKTMLQFSNQSFGDDTSLGIAPRGPGDSSAPKVNWLEELTGR